MSVTIKDIANETGLSWPTVSRILNGKGHLFKEDTRQRVVNKARELGYVPNAAARGMKTNKTYHIGALLLNRPEQPLHYPASFEILQGINQSLEEASYVLSLIRIRDIHEDEDVQSRVFREKMLDGMICLDALSEAMVQQVKKLIPRCIWLDANHKEPHFCVYRDEEKVGELAANRMIGLGYRRIKFLRSGLPTSKTASKIGRHFSMESRCLGVESACRRQGVPIDIVTIPHWKNAGYPAMIKQLWEEEAGLIANGPHDAVRLMHWAHQLNLPVGRHIGLSSCDMAEDIRMAVPGLSHVTNNRFDLGKQAARMMLQLLAKPKLQCASIAMTGQWFAGDTAYGPIDNQTPTSSVMPSK